MKMEEGVSLFNQQMYWECHESLEDVWMDDKGDNARNVYWAVIQIAAACIHYRDGNQVGYEGMNKKAKEKFQRCRSLNVLTSLAFDFLDWDELEALSMADDYEGLWNFRFKNYKRVP